MKKNKIPCDLEEALEIMIKTNKKEDLEKFKSMNENDAVCNLHFGAGMALRNGWSLWGENNLTKWFNTIGISHADDMSGIIYTTLHRKLNDKEYELAQQVKKYQDHWKRAGIADGIPKKER